MVKVNLRTLKKTEIFDSYKTTVNKIWNDEKIDIFINFDDKMTLKKDKDFVKKKIPVIEERLNTIEESKELIAKNIIKSNFLAYFDETDDMLTPKPFKPKKNKKFLEHLEHFGKTKLRKCKIKGENCYFDCYDGNYSAIV